MDRFKEGPGWADDTEEDDVKYAEADADEDDGVKGAWGE
jgi:hypothetical protein